MNKYKKKNRRHILIISGNSDIGLAITKTFLEKNEIVSITYNSNYYKNNCFLKQCLQVKMDVTNPISVDSGIQYIEEKQGPIEVLIFNSGINRDKAIFNMLEKDFTDILQVNLIGAFRVIRKIVRNFIKLKKGLGRIIFISSIAGHCGSAGQVNYAASKSGIFGMARSLARELGSRKITVNTVCPGIVKTKMIDNLTKNIKNNYLRKIPLKSFAEVEDVANTVHWLASNQAKYISGAFIPVDGGLSMGH